MNFQDLVNKNNREPITTYKNIHDIVREIVEEGEGAAKFESRAYEFLARIKEIGGTRSYLEALLLDRTQRSNPSYETPKWLEEGEHLRKSHLYRFVTIMMDLKQEAELCVASGVDFEPSRKPVNLKSKNYGIKQLIDDLPKQFNACYLVLLVWLGRIYDAEHWKEDRFNRQAIEMIAAWPMMSIAIRPFLELMSFFPVNPQLLFRIEEDTLPLTPIYTQQLLQLYQSNRRSDEINQMTDYLSIHILTSISSWAKDQYELLSESIASSEVKDMILTRIKLLTQLEEIEKQFMFRVHGGYSSKLPDLTYQQSQTDAGKFSEDPSGLELYKNSIIVRLRFCGRGLVQMATDPDPPSDEVGCAGTHMLHASDWNKKLDGSIAWQRTDPDTTIQREPVGEVPMLGIKCVDVSLLVTDSIARAGYKPLDNMSPSGSLKDAEAEYDLAVEGLYELFNLKCKDILENGQEIQIDLLEKNGSKPVLTGLNHLISRDGEPIDPFILAILLKSSSDSQVTKTDLLFKREIFNQDLSFQEMTPMQRALSSRWPCGFDSYVNLPEWVLDQIPQNERNLLSDENYPSSYLIARAKVLAKSLSLKLRNEYSQKDVDVAVSFAERMLRISVPRGTTVGWLRILLNYGHTLSGRFSGKSNNTIFEAIEKSTNLRVTFVDDSNRDNPNSRWLVHYTLGIMDTDALPNLAYGEVFIPVSIIQTDKPVKLVKRWKFHLQIRPAISEYACRFNNPFWDRFEVMNDTRIFHFLKERITERLEASDNEHYTYSFTGFNGISDCKGLFRINASDTANEYFELEWNISFKYSDQESVIKFLTYYGMTVRNMAESMRGQFNPVAN